MPRWFAMACITELPPQSAMLPYVKINGTTGNGFIVTTIGVAAGVIPQVLLRTFCG